MKKLEHPHIVRFVGAYTADHSLSILMTPSADFDLAYLIGSHSRAVNTEIVLQWFSCLASSVDYLHSNCVKHQDIKPSNILIRGDTIFLADFGVSKTFNDFDSTSSTSGNMTRKYCSPETAYDGYRGRKSDIFSLGCVFLEMLSFLLHDDETNFRDYQWKHFVGDGVFHENLPGIKQWLNVLFSKAASLSSRSNLTKVIDTCRKMLEEDPCDRPSTRELAKKFMPGECCLMEESQKPADPFRYIHDQIKMPDKSSTCNSSPEAVKFERRNSSSNSADIWSSGHIQPMAVPAANEYDKTKIDKEAETENFATAPELPDAEVPTKTWTTALEELLETQKKRRLLRYIGRPRPFPQGLEKYSKLIDTIYDETTFLPLVWGSIKFILQVIFHNLIRSKNSTLTLLYRSPATIQSSWINFWMRILE